MSQNLAVQSLVDALVAAIRERILTGQLAGGALLTEKDVSSYYDVARPTAKAALERLVYEGLLRRGVNKTARVPLLGVDDIRDLYYCRGFIEREVVEALALVRHVPAAAESAMAIMESVIDNPVGSKIVESDIAFHRALVDALDSPRLNRVYQAVIGEMHLCMAQGQIHRLIPPRVIFDEHVAILAAIRDGDAVKARARLVEHLELGYDRVIGYLEPNDDPEIDERPVPVAAKPRASAGKRKR